MTKIEYFGNPHPHGEDGEPLPSDAMIKCSRRAQNYKTVTGIMHAYELVGLSYMGELDGNLGSITYEVLE